MRHSFKSQHRIIMKVIILAALFVAQAAAFTVVTKEQVLSFYDECGEELQVSADRLAQFKAGQFEKDKLSTDQLFCVAQKMKTIDADGNIISNNLAEQLHVYNPDKTVEYLSGEVEKCNNSAIGENKARALKGFRCLRKAGLKTTYSELTQ